LALVVFLPCILLTLPQAPKIFAKVFVGNERLQNQLAMRDIRSSEKRYVWGGEIYHM
jgi:hypothetical protein